MVFIAHKFVVMDSSAARESGAYWRVEVWQEAKTRHVLVCLLLLSLACYPSNSCGKSWKVTGVNAALGCCIKPRVYIEVVVLGVKVKH